MLKGSVNSWKKKVILLSYNISDPGDIGSNEMILVQISTSKAIETVAGTPIPHNKEKMVSPSARMQNRCKSMAFIASTL